jgi:formate hydrogenlyase subunit 4
MAYLNLILALVFAPLMPGIINKVKALFAGRKGPPVLQLYFDLYKLFQKRPIYSKTTSCLLPIAPIISLVSIATIMLMIPFGKESSIIAFDGDLIFIAYLLAISRLMTVLGALDTGSSFEGMGASREVSFAVFVEPSIFLVFASLAQKTQLLSLSQIYHAILNGPFKDFVPFLILIALVLLIIILVENCRIPIDDPNTHLELTMIHEVMVLDYSSKDLGIILYGSSLKLWTLGSLLATFFIPADIGAVREGLFLLGMLTIALIIGVIESITARLRLIEVFDLLLLALATAVFAFLIQVGKL